MSAERNSERQAERPLVSVIIPTTGNSPHLKALLERLCQQTFRSDLSANRPPFEVLLIANIPRQDLRNLMASIDRTASVKFEYLETGKMGVNLARNKGLERATGNVALFLDDDAILEDLIVDAEHFLQAHYEKHLEYPEAIAIGGPYRLVGATSRWDLTYHHIAAQWIRMHRRAHNRVEQLLGGNLSFKLDRIRTLSERFDEAIPYGGAETGICQRLVEHKEELLFFDELVVGHAPGMSRKSLMKKAYLQGAGAAWRQANLGDARFVGPDTLRPRDPLAKARGAIRLYDLCFKYGWEKSPFKSDLVKNSAISFPVLGFLLFLCRQALAEGLKTWPKSFLRRLYASSRSIWISARY